MNYHTSFPDPYITPMFWPFTLLSLITSLALGYSMTKELTWRSCLSFAYTIASTVIALATSSACIDIYQAAITWYSGTSLIGVGAIVYIWTDDARLIIGWRKFFNASKKQKWPFIIYLLLMFSHISIVGIGWKLTSLQKNIASISCVDFGYSSSFVNKNKICVFNRHNDTYLTDMFNSYDPFLLLSNITDPNKTKRRKEIGGLEWVCDDNSVNTHLLPDIVVSSFYTLGVAGVVMANPLVTLTGSILTTMTSIGTSIQLQHAFDRYSQQFLLRPCHDYSSQRENYTYPYTDMLALPSSIFPSTIYWNNTDTIREDGLSSQMTSYLKRMQVPFGWTQIPFF